MLLARKGYRVLLVDRSTFPSDMAMSTHLIWHPGVARLQRWGLLDRVRASNCPPISVFNIDLGPFTLTGSPPSAEGVAEAYAPRRVVLDKILVDAAVEAGAELREGFSVQELVRDGERVTGVRGRTRGSTAVTAEARIVIGADGMQSPVARAVQAPEYNVKPPLQGTYFTYWSGVPMHGLEFYPREYRGVYGFLSNDGLALIGVNWTARDFPDVRADIEGNYLRVLGMCAPDLAERVRHGKRAERWRGGTIANFCRRPYGSGWALVGDAGLTMDPCTAEGITNAFRDAEFLVEAIDDGFCGHRPLDVAFADYEQRRNDAAMPVYEFTCQLAPFAPPPPEILQLYNALHGNQTETECFLGLFAQTVSIPEFFAPENFQRIIGAASPGAPTIEKH
jgi:2-polyprenyl-6-methoxyphenol hydroxylase-like FAD-dependent oxidoreductase